ncbi:MAG TPA: HTH domain-containing protein [Nitrososphaeraceae archaeon]|nr:HTH domain-containing protein [Nitrososphaeraceae archaeon]HEU5172374.1 HTH domain-containing protein [Nitrososphaeraceae archaeon]
MYRRYTIDEIKNKVVEILRNHEEGMSSIELADAIHVNRMTITKYLNILSAIGLIKRKKIGSINIWTIESGVEDIEFPLDYLHLQQRFITSLVGYNKRELSKILLNIIYSDTEVLKILKEIIIPSSNTIKGLYDRGRLGKTELIYLYNLLFDLVILIEIYHKNTEYNKNIHNIFIAGNQDQILNSKILSVASEVSNCDTIYIGNIEQHIDPFFDIDLQRYITKFWLHKKGTKVIFLCCSEESSLRFLFTAVDYIKRKMTENIKIVLFVNSEILDLAKDLKFDFITSDLNSLIIWLEELIKQIKNRI